MNCTHCGASVEADSRFCRLCGSRIATSGANQPSRLFRRAENGRVAGVCAGLAEYFGADVTIVRVVWVVLSIVPGGFVGGFLAYLAAWIVMPLASTPARTGAPVKRLMSSPDDRKLGGVCGGIAEYLRLDSTIVRLAWIVLTVVPGAVVLGVVAYIALWYFMPASHPAAMTPAASVA